MIKKGFTLAEVLITLVIIGVVAALTLPALNNNVSKQALEKKTLKMYSAMTQAFETYKAENETDRITGIGFGDGKAFVKKYFDTTTFCTSAADCLANEYYSIDGTKYGSVLGYWAISSTKPAYVLQDGAVFKFTGDPDKNSLYLYFDVNGKKGPNKIGYDMWDVKVWWDGSIDDIDPSTKKDPDKAAEVKSKIKTGLEDCKKEGYAGCFGHFIRNGFKLDY